VSSLVISLPDLAEGGVHIHEIMDAGHVQTVDSEPLITNRVTIDGMFSGGDGTYFFDGAISGDYTGACDRCNEVVESPFNVRVRWTFMESDPDIPDDQWETGGAEDAQGVVSSTLAYQGEEINLMPQIWEEIVLARPSKYPPLSDNRQKCTVCGEDISELSYAPSEEQAQRPTTDSKFAGLRELYPDLPEHSEDNLPEDRNPKEK